MTTAVDSQPAADDHATALVELFAESSGGVWPAVWEASAAPSETAEATAKRLLLSANADLCVASTVIACAGKSLLGAMCCYEESPAPANAPVMPEALQHALEPFSSLRVANSWFIAELCCLPEARGRGVGSALLRHAIDQATARQFARLSLRVFSENTSAIRLYERMGFSIHDQRALVPHPRIAARGAVYAMVLDLG